MWAPNPDTVSAFLAPPVFPATILMSLIIIWGILGLIGAIGLDLLHVDLDGDLHLPHTSLGLGGMTLRWLNVRDVPAMLWLGIFGLAWWIVSLVLWLAFDNPGDGATWMTNGLLIARNAVIAIGITKAATEPMIGRFKSGEKFSQDTLIGQICTISTSVATSTSGQAKYKTDAAPLLLNIHTDGEELTKGTLVRIVDCDSQRRIYLVTRATGELS